MSEQPPYSCILVATGGAPHSQVAVQRATQLARHFGSPLHVITVVPQGATPLMNAALAVPGAETLELQAKTDEYAAREAHLRRTADEARAQGLSVTEHLVPALKAADAILAVAAEVHADLIVLGRKHRSAWTAALAGSVSDMVSHAAAADVLVVR